MQETTAERVRRVVAERIRGKSDEQLRAEAETALDALVAIPCPRKAIAVSTGHWRKTNKG